MSYIIDSFQTKKAVNFEKKLICIPQAGGVSANIISIFFSNFMYRI